METHTDAQEFSKQKREQYKTHIDIKCVGDKYLKKNFFFFGSSSSPRSFAATNTISYARAHKRTQSCAYVHTCSTLATFNTKTEYGYFLCSLRQRIDS